MEGLSTEARVLLDVFVIMLLMGSLFLMIYYKVNVRPLLLPYGGLLLVLANALAQHVSEAYSWSSEIMFRQASLAMFAIVAAALFPGYILNKVQHKAVRLLLLVGVIFGIGAILWAVLLSKA